MCCDSWKSAWPSGPLRHDAPIPFFHFFGGKMQMEMLPGNV